MRAGGTVRPRLTVFGAAVVATVFKLFVAARTFGTNDVHSWLSFSEGVRRYGPVGMYGHEYFTLYNHAPLSGRLLVAVNWLVDHQLGTFTFWIRVPAVLADLVVVGPCLPPTDASTFHDAGILGPWHASSDPFGGAKQVCQLVHIVIRLHLTAKGEYRENPEIIGDLLLRHDPRTVRCADGRGRDPGP